MIGAHGVPGSRVLELLWVALACGSFLRLLALWESAVVRVHFFLLEPLSETFWAALGRALMLSFSRGTLAACFPLVLGSVGGAMTKVEV